MPASESLRRRPPNVVIAAFMALIFIYSLKLSFPHRSFHSTYGTLKKSSDYLAQAHLPTIASPLPDNSLELNSGSLESSLPTSPQLGNSRVAGQAHTTSETSKKLANVVLDSTVYNYKNASKAAVIIETRLRPNLVPLILHFAAVLGPEWPIYIYTSIEHIGMFSASAAFTRFRNIGRIELRILPMTVLFTSSDSVSQFMTKPWYVNLSARSDYDAYDAS
jgi:hypothetical protein